MTDAFRAELAKQGKRERKHTTDHEYSLEEFGLEADAIRDQLGVLFERFGWDAEEEGPSQDGRARRPDERGFEGRGADRPMACSMPSDSTVASRS